MQLLILLLLVMDLRLLADGGPIEAPAPSPLLTFDLQVHTEVDPAQLALIEENKATGTKWKKELKSREFPLFLPLILAIIGFATWIFLKKPAPITNDESESVLKELKESLLRALQNLKEAKTADDKGELFEDLDQKFRQYCLYCFGSESKWPDEVQNYLKEHEDKLNLIKFAKSSPAKDEISSYTTFLNQFLM